MILTIDDDLDLNKIAESGQDFRIRVDDTGTCLMITKGHAARIRKTGDNTYDFDGDQNEFDEIFDPYLDLQMNYRQVRQELHLDPFMERTVEFGKGLRILNQEPFQTLVSFILSQRKSIPAIQKNVESLCETYGKPIEGSKQKNNGTELFSFPDPEDLSGVTEQTYREMGFGYRAPYVEDAAKRAKEGLLDNAENLSDEELLNLLMEVKGVGIKVANCTALFAYHRFCLAPVDTWIQKVIDNVYDGVNPFPDYGPYAGLVQQYVFYYCIHGGKIEKP